LSAFEIVEQLEEAPDVLAIPVGNAGNITAYWKGFKAGIARTSGASSNCSTISNAPVFCPSILNGLTEFTLKLSNN
jgi:threonine synthase